MTVKKVHKKATPKPVPKGKALLIHKAIMLHKDEAEVITEKAVRKQKWARRKQKKKK